jgi:hypothetical protein
MTSFRLANAEKSKIEPTLSNPFATRFVRPGATPFLFRDGQTARSVIDTLKDCGWRGAIVGPHGTGKTTLLHTVMPELVASGKKPVTVTLHDGQRRLPFSRTEWRALDGRSVLIIDGYEQLGRSSRTVVWLKQKLQGFGLLVTAHADLRLLTIYRTRGDLDLLNDLVEQCLPCNGGRILAGDIARAFTRRAGNIREALFDLYDLFEQRRTKSTILVTF